ncbi:MAG TPA: phosphatidylserine/phosphatidylglycerophosphate/cardiolipin synthase family protein, partial [Pirellulales bacterium]|nr:phosphatidylserine/phosphatidylglycerophosphate/cardiolipin synthase family protein [Pirellulales bacterium]
MDTQAMAWYGRLLSGLLFVAWSGVLAQAGENKFRLLHADHEAAQARADVIRSATKSIETTYYWIGDDRIGAWYMSLLLEAACRGVRVRLVVDADYNDVPPTVERRLVSSGVEIKEFHPRGRGQLSWLNRRMHDKTIIVDDRQLIVGSRNMRDSHFGLAKLNYVDRDAYLCGEVAAHARRYFDCLWNCDQVGWTDFEQTAEQRRRQRKAERSGEFLASYGDKSVSPDRWFAAGCKVTICGEPIECDAYDWCAEACPACGVCFVYDPCGIKGHPRGISQQLLNFLASARGSIVLETPYFVMSHDLKRVLGDATARGVHVLLLTNSLASTDQKCVTAEFHNQKHWLLAHGVEIWELAGPNHLHAKSAVVDRSAAFVGSYNFDPRSELLNTETGVIVHDAGVAEWVLNSIGEHLGRSYQFGPDGRAVADGSRHPGASLGRILHMQSTRLFAPLFRKSL